MSFQVNTAFVQQFKGNVGFLLQQQDSRFRMAVTEDEYIGTGGKSVEQLGAVTAKKKTTRHGDTPLISTPHDARWVFPADYEWADLIDNEDKVRMLIDPTSPYAINGASAMRRAMDDEVIDAFFSDAKTGEKGTTTTTFPSSQQVAVTVGAAAATGLNVAKLKRAKKILRANEADLDNDPLWIAISAEQEEDLLEEIEVISGDFNRPVLMDGKLQSFLGFNFIHSERLDVNGSSQRRCPVWVKSGMHLGIWADMVTEISKRDDKSYSTQVYLRETLGATRLEEKKVVEIICDET